MKKYGASVAGIAFLAGATLAAQNAQIKHTLERSGNASVEVVGRGDEALRSINGRLPDLVILDLNLPVVSGDEVCRILRQRAETKQLPIIMLTARTSDNAQLTLLTRHTVDYQRE
jgi:DNA-binding response OmpR family regulator